MTLTSWNPPIPKVIRSVSDSFLERSAPNVNDLFSGSAPVLERNLIISLLDSRTRGGTPILGHIRDVRPEWVSFPGQKPADGCKFLRYLIFNIIAKHSDNCDFLA